MIANSPTSDFLMVCDRPCVSVAGLLIHSGTRVRFLAKASKISLRVLMEDGSTQEVNSYSFVQWRALEEFRARALRAIQSANVGHGSLGEVPWLREAIAALPERALLSRLPGEVRSFIETNLALIKSAESPQGVQK